MAKPLRCGQVLRLKPEHREEYVRYHANVWPEISKTITDGNIRNYSVFLKDDLLFAYFEYVGNDLQADWEKMVANPKMKEWWAIMTPMQIPLPTRAEGEWWANMAEVFHLD
jgi:L-rhamnose mutarotase